MHRTNNGSFKAERMRRAVSSLVDENTTPITEIGELPLDYLKKEYPGIYTNLSWAIGHWFIRIYSAGNFPEELPAVLDDMQNLLDKAASIQGVNSDEELRILFAKRLLPNEAVRIETGLYLDYDPKWKINLTRILLRLLAIVPGKDGAYAAILYKSIDFYTHHKRPRA